MMYCEAELCLAASIFGRGGILSENHKGGKVTVHSAKNTSKFDSTVGRSANCADQLNISPSPPLAGVAIEKTGLCCVEEAKIFDKTCVGLLSMRRIHRGIIRCM